MNMNKRFLIPALAWSLLALSFAGCTDDNMSGSDPLPEGTEFDFGTTVESNRTRTYYDPADVADPDATSWKIFWNYESSWTTSTSIPPRRWQAPIRLRTPSRPRRTW